MLDFSFHFFDNGFGTSYNIFQRCVMNRAVPPLSACIKQLNNTFSNHPIITMVAIIEAMEKQVDFSLIFDMSYAVLFHFAVHWTQASDTKLWPFSVHHAIYLWNSFSQSKTKIFPFNCFTEELHYDAVGLQWFHVFGCPVYCPRSNFAHLFHYLF